jgi:hypothetical protein
MIAVLVASVVWLIVGHAVLGGLFWGLLQVPESNAWMLAVSALLVLLLFVVGGWVETTAALMWVRPSGVRERSRRALGALPVFLLGLIVFGAAWWVSGWFASYAVAHRGGIDAALMARFGWTRTGWIHEALAWIAWFVRYPIGLSLALAATISGAVDGPRAVIRLRWIARALSPVRLLVVALWLLLFVWLPWQAAYWRPRSVPTNWVEPVFVAAKLLVIYLLMNIGWSLVLRALARRKPAATPPPV